MNHSAQILADSLQFPEGPAFDPAGNLWCVELHGGNLVRWAEGRLERFPMVGAPNGLAFDAAGRAWICDAGQNAIRVFDPASGTWETVAAELGGMPLLKPNDLAFDTAGNLVFTCPGDSRTAPDGYVCCLRPDGELVKIAEGMYFPNGLAFLDEGRTLVLAETYRMRLWKGAWDAREAHWVNPWIWAELGEPTGPDGMAAGADGLLYVAVFRSGQIKAVNALGHVVAGYRLPGERPTNVAFDPAGQLGLVVTEAERGLLLSLPNLGPGVRLYDGSCA